MTRKQIRMTWISSIGLVLTVAVGLTLFALRTKIAFAVTPSELLAKNIGPGDRVRLFGLVKEKSVIRGQGLNVLFELTDRDKTVSVVFNGLLPDLFREGQGIITEGSLGTDAVFRADTVLAKHDEKYIPKELAQSMKEKGLWRGENDER